MKTKSALLAVVIGLLCGIFSVAAQDEGAVYATAQRFENGLMIWRSDTGDIWALAKGGQAYAFHLADYKLLPDNPISSVPAGRILPILGFGKVWGNIPTVRDALGWATLPEIGFQMPVRYADQTYYFTQLDGSVIQVRPDDTWSHSSDLSPSTPAILSFNASPIPVQPNGTVTLSWEAQGVGAVLLECYDQDNQLFSFIEDMPLVSSEAITVPAHATSVRFVLWGANRTHFTPPTMSMWERVVQAEVTVNVDMSAVSAITTPATFQAYEHGFMIWRADTGMIDVFPPFIYGGRPWPTPLSDYASLPDNPITNVPLGFIRPINGFGQVWGSSELLRRALGWATASELGYSLTVRMFKDTPLSFSLPDGRSVYINNWGIWEF